MTQSDARERPIPGSAGEVLRIKNYRMYPMNMNHASQRDSFADVHDLGIAGYNLYYQSDIGPYYERIPGAIQNILVRAAVGEKLQRVNERLAPRGLELFIFDAYRPPLVQDYFYNHWTPTWLRRMDPALEGVRLTEEVEKYWSRIGKGGVVDPLSPPAHTTGGAVDTTVRRRATGELLYMGAVMDDPSDVSATDHFERHYNPRSLSDQEARTNRRILYWTMIEEGFANIPSELWHYSYGDQMWAKAMGEPAAVYSDMTPKVQAHGKI